MAYWESALVYDGLPISSGGAHGLGRIGAHEAYSAWANFLSVCTRHEAIDCYFDFPNTPELSVDPRVRSTIDEAFPAVGGRHAVATQRIHEALDLLVTLEPQPTNPWGMAPVWLRFFAPFALKDPAGQVWPGQDPINFGHFETPTGVRLGSSLTNLSLQAKRSIGLLLSVPNATDEDLAELAPWLQSHLPFRLSPKHWSRWTLTKNGGAYRGRKLAP